MAGADPLLTVAALLPTCFYIYSYPSLRGISHTDIYFVYVAQIFNGFAPPDSVFLPGFAASHYWLFNALIAALVKLTALDVYSTANLVNNVFIFSSLFWLGQTLLTLKLAKSRTMFLFFAIMFLLGALNLSGILSAISVAISEADTPIRRSNMLLAGADRRLHSTVYKLFHASGFTPGFAAFAAVLYCSAQFLRSSLELSKLVLVSASIIVSLAIMPIIVPFVALVFAGTAPIALYSGVSHMGGAQRFLVIVRSILADLGAGRLIAWLSLSFALAIPLLNYAIGILNSVDGELILLQEVDKNIRVTLAAHFILLTFLLFLLLCAWKRPRREIAFLLINVFAGLVLALVIELPDDNQYKFHYPLSVLLALATLMMLRMWRRSRVTRLRQLAPFAAVLLIALALLNCAYAQLALVTRVEQSYGTARYEGVNAELQNSDLGRRLSALYWIRTTRGMTLSSCCPSHIPATPA